MSDILSNVLEAVANLGGLGWIAKVAGLIVAGISLIKSSFLKQTVWDKLGAGQSWMAPIVGLVCGVISLYPNLSVASLVAYMGAGAGAVLLHELLDSVKEMPFVGPFWKSVIEFVESKLGGGAK